MGMGLPIAVLQRLIRLHCSVSVSVRAMDSQSNDTGFDPQSSRDICPDPKSIVECCTVKLLVYSAMLVAIMPETNLICFSMASLDIILCLTRVTRWLDYKY